MKSDLTHERSRPRVAVVGAGYFSQFHLRGWQQCGAEIVAICDRDQTRARTQADRFSVSKTYDDTQKLISESQFDVLDVAVPPAFQSEVVNAAIDARVPVICQKPFLESYQDALALAQRAQDAGIPLLIHENFRFMPWFREAKRFIDNGQLGSVYEVMFRLRPGDGQGSDAYLDRQPYFRQMRRFLIVETAIHYIDTFRFLLGEIVAVTARLRRVNPHVLGEDAGVFIFEFESGAVAVLDANRSSDHAAQNPRRTMGEMWLEGEAGCLRLDGDASLWWKPHHGTEAQHRYASGSSDPLDFGGGACAALQRSALDALAHRAPAENTALDYLENIRIQEALYHSHECGQRIEMRTFNPPSVSVIPTLSIPQS